MRRRRGKLRNRERKINETNSEEGKEVNRRKGRRGVLEGERRLCPSFEGLGAEQPRLSLQRWSVLRKLVV